MEPVQFSVEGTRVHGEFHAAAKAKASAVLLHGLHSCLQEFADLPARLAAAGVHTLVFDQRGFGASAGERGRTNLDRAMADTDAATQWLQDRVGRKPLFLIGHSLGGAYALGIASRRRFDGVVVAHPIGRIFDEVTRPKAAAYHVLGRLNQRRMTKGKPAMTLRNPTNYTSMFVDKQARQRARDAPFLMERLNLGNYQFAATMDARDWSPRVKVPALAILSPRDKVVTPKHTRDVVDLLGGPVTVLEHAGGHSCFLDLDGDKVMSGIVDWILEAA